MILDCLACQTGRDDRAAPTEAAMLGAAFGALPIMQTPPTARWLFFSGTLENNHRRRFTRFIAPVILALMLFSACTRSHKSVSLGTHGRLKLAHEAEATGLPAEPVKSVGDIG